MRDVILVLGSTGKVGKRVTARLRVRGESVRAVSRRSHIRFDWGDTETWTPALGSVTAVYAVAPPTLGLMPDFIDRATEAGVKKLILLSGRGADIWGTFPYGKEMVDAENAVRDSSLEWTIVRATNFNQNFDEGQFHAPLMAGELRLPAAEVPEPLVDTEDVAEVVTTVLTEDGHGGRTYELSGPETLTFSDAVGRIARATGRELLFTRVTSAHYVAEQESAGWDRAEAVSVANMFEFLARGIQQDPTDGVRSVLGKSPRTFEDFVVAAASRGSWDAPDPDALSSA